MDQTKLTGVVGLSKTISDHLDTIYESQDSLYLDWLASLPKLKQDDSCESDSDTPKYIWA